jgi:hypothetical protein
MPKCIRCGRFCQPVDSGIPFGGPADFEPPDEEFWCYLCVSKELADAVTEGWVPNYWIKPRWTRAAAAALAEIRRVGLGGRRVTLPLGPEALRAALANITGTHL